MRLVSRRKHRKFTEPIKCQFSVLVWPFWETSEQPQLEPKTIYVTNINYKSEGTQLAQFFEKYGKVKSARILTERFRGKVLSRGIGFVEFENVEGFNAIMKANEEAQTKKEYIQFEGRSLFIRQARIRPERKRDAAFIGGIPEGTTVDDLKNAFKDYNVVDAKIIRFNNKDNVGGFAFVKFASTDDQTKAVKDNRKIVLGGKDSIVRFALRDYDFASQRKPLRRRRFRRRAPKKDGAAAETKQ